MINGGGDQISSHEFDTENDVIQLAEKIGHPGTSRYLDHTSTCEKVSNPPDRPG